MIFRLSQNLNRKIHAGPTKAAPLDSNAYADWTARLFTADRTQYILVSNTRSLYSVLMYGRGITSDHRFIERALATIREFMQDDGLEFVYRQFVAPATGSVDFRKALDRTVTGSMNELVATAQALLADEELSPFDVGFRLNDTLLSAASRDVSDDYATPREAIKWLSR